MPKIFLLSIIFFYSHYCFAQTNEAAYIQGNISISPKIFSQNKIKKEVIFSVYMNRAKEDSFIHKTKFYDSTGYITKETYPFLTGTGTTLFSYGPHNKLIKEYSPDTPSEDVEYSYDQYGNLINTSKKSNDKKLRSVRSEYNAQQQLIKRLDIVGDNDINSTEQYCYNATGKIDSIIIFQNSERYVQYYQYSKDNDTVTIFYNNKTINGNNRYIYNKDKQLLMTITRETSQQYSKEVVVEFFYNADGTIRQENTSSSESQGTYSSVRQTSYDHYYFQ
ncbi:MAG TPA: hypothetical protein VK559_03995 [Ferruginibacter sp.]|nr:hypothetical protein [Ferruginibacter sp.]